MEIININDQDVLKKSIETLQKGGVIIYPTETCYGVGCDATNPDAITKLLKYKNKEPGKSLPIAVNNIEMAERYVELNDTARDLYKNFLPGPVMIISKSRGLVDQRLHSEQEIIGVRIPNFRKLLEIITELKKPIVTTAANKKGKKTPYSIKDILENISEKQRSQIDLIIDGGELPKNPPSTVIDTTNENPTIYRSGRIDPTKLRLIETIATTSEEETIDYSSQLFKKLENRSLILLNGELGAGKTHFTKGIAKELGVNQIIKSPTYNYVNEYKLENGRKLIHFDAWRIQSKEDLEAIGFYEWIKGNNIVIVEWPSVISYLDPSAFENTAYTYIDFIESIDNSRKIKVYKTKN